ncbi:MAG: DUF4293 family protein [Bacteroidia bacterium]
MIQRKQTLWLAFISFICFSSVYINIPFYEVDGKLDKKVIENAIASVGFSETVITIEKERTKLVANTFLKYDTLLLGLCSLASIFLFKNRKRQFLLSKVIYGLISAMAILMYYYGWSVRYVDLEPDGQIIISILFPLLLWLANFKATAGLKHDDKLVKSYDRIR